ncbi:MAG: bifunctional DNA primase/polymerase [Candidatus Aenigmarchaeota archaeon]|nr:bifunctional DNA primase/polymerase [Candidatus Aenigmarchaeota archaeon]
MTIEIPEQLRKKEFRFVLLKPKTKIPFEKDWQSKNNYSFDDPKLIKHLEDGGNYGIVCRYGNLRILDIDNPELIEHFDVMQTFTVKTGRGGRHFYFISDYGINHVLAGRKGELRANNYQVVGAGCIHPNGKIYEITKDLPILEIEDKELRKIIEPYLRLETSTTEIDFNKPTDQTRSGIEFGEICKLIRKGCTKEQIFERMMVFSKWSDAPPQYRELTYKKAIDKVNTNGVKQSEHDVQSEHIKSGGYVSAEIVIEPIGSRRYIYNTIKKRGSTQSEHDKEKGWYLEIEGKTYVFVNPPLLKPLFRVLKEEDIEAWINKKYKVKTGQEIFNSIMQYFKTIYDLEDKYYPILALGKLQSWLTPILNTVFYIGLEAKRGAGKTSILEGSDIVSRHGFLVGNVTEAIARDIDAQQLSVFADEIDNRTKGKDNPLYQCFRQGYRRNNPYLRHREKTFEPERYDGFGYKEFSVHADIEKALKDRSIMIPTKVTLDKRLPILNIFKEQIGYSVFKDLFFWYLDNISNSFTLYHSFTLFSCFMNDNSKTIEEKRQLLYEEITKSFSIEEIGLLSQFVGRNIEILFIALTICKAFNLDLKANLKEIIEEKQSYDDIPDAYLIDLLKEALVVIHADNKDNQDFRIQKGDFIGCFFYPKTKTFEAYRDKLSGKGITRFSSYTFTEYLRELNFEDKVNVKMERIGFDERTKAKCLIFDDSILKTLGIEDKPEQKTLEDEHDIT